MCVNAIWFSLYIYIYKWIIGTFFFLFDITICSSKCDESVGYLVVQVTQRGLERSLHAYGEISTNATSWKPMINRKRFFLFYFTNVRKSLFYTESKINFIKAEYKWEPSFYDWIEINMMTDLYNKKLFAIFFAEKLMRNLIDHFIKVLER